MIGDHMPPNKLMQGNKDQLGKWVGELPIVGKVGGVGKLFSPHSHPDPVCRSTNGRLC